MANYDNVTSSSDTVNSTEWARMANRIKSYVLVGSSSECDYVTDGTADQTEINNAISYASSNNIGCVRIKSGSYNISAPIVISDAMIFEGEGENTIITLANSSNCNMISVTADNVIIQNIKFNGNGSNQTGVRYVIQVTTQDNITVRNCHIINPRSVGIDFVTVTNSYILNNYIYNSLSDGIKLHTSCEGINIIGNIVDTCGALGIACGDYGNASSHLVVSNNIVSDTGDNGIDFNGTTFSIINGNNIRNNTVNGICLDSAPENVVSNNVVYNTALAGIFLNDSSGGNADRCLISGNRVTHATANYCLELEADNCSVVNNYFYDSAIVDIYIYGASSGTVLLNNVYSTITDGGTNTLKGYTGTIAAASGVVVVKGVVTGYT